MALRRRLPELVVLPLVYWGALNIWFKRSGAYAGYYGSIFRCSPICSRDGTLFLSDGLRRMLWRGRAETAMAHRLLFALVIVIARHR